MKFKIGVLALILAAALMAFASCTKDPNAGQNADANYHVHITKVASSTSGITLSWVDDKGDNINYTIKVYNDAGCKDLYQSYTIAFKDGENKRFTIPYLESNKQYYICVENVSGSKSKPFEVLLKATTFRRPIITQDFDKLFWGYDYINLAHSVVIKDGNPNTYIIDNFADAIADSEVTSKIDNHGGLLFNYKPTMLKLMGFGGWDKSKNKSVIVLPGYVKLGSRSETGVLCTPTFSALGDKTETAIITFDACVYASSLSASGGKIKVSVYKGDDTTPIASKDCNLKGVTGKPAWEPCKLIVENVTKDCYCKIETAADSKQICVDNLQIVQDYKIPENHIYGYVTDAETGEAIEGIVMSNGLKITTTDEYGMYLFPRDREAKLVYYSTPAEYEITMHAFQPAFYSNITAESNEYNFSLKKLPGGKEHKFALFTFADPQVSSNDKLKRLKDEFTPAVKAHSSTLGIPCYGITLGDIVSNGNESNTLSFMKDVRDYMRSDNIGIPVFQVMGNHDCDFFNEKAPLPLESDRNESIDYTNDHREQIKAQHSFEKNLGPVNYSFSRGDVHIVAMRDILYASNITQSGYSTGFTKEQYEWLVEDLSYVSRDKMVVLCVHIPLYSKVTNSGEDGHYIQEVHELLNEFSEAHILSGHMHTHTNYQHEDYNIYEHNQASVCGAWWLSNITGDGVPNGYGVFIGEGNTFSDWYYMGYPKNMNTREHQMRLYRGDAITGAERPSNNKPKYAGYYQFNFGEDVILANVYNADKDWIIEVYEDDICTGTMQRVSTSKSVSFSKLIGSYTKDDPRRIKEGTVGAYDMWVTGVHLSLDENTSSARGWTICSHLYKYELQNPEAQSITVVAKDRFGNFYEESTFTDYNNHSIALKP